MVEAAENGLNRITLCNIIEHAACGPIPGDTENQMCVSVFGPRVMESLADSRNTVLELATFVRSEQGTESCVEQSVRH